MSKSIQRMAAAGLAVAVALGLAACASTDNPPQAIAGTYMADAEITSKVKTALFSDVGARAGTEIIVNTQRGQVLLTGLAQSYDEVDKAVNAARKVSGVRQVHNDIQVRRG
jgi:hyperosmotically inducible protein